ncbi:unnamed protein product [Callosobruchus maculatus]|uniref:Farnesyl pyrophosphate synthase n=1 Tax=Callosobruchus maculatus TaxID=64391 RepID=A0A653CRE9_CALMS|nr:unnamed protein product [Callosobruchus maculatus]
MDVPDFNKRYAKVLQYNVPNNENHLGLPTVVCYKALERPENLTSENLMVVNVIGWCAEMLASCIVIIDDVMDRSPIRYHKPSWYSQKDVGLTAIYDALLIVSGIHDLLRKYVGGRKCCTYIMELLHEVATKAIIGQTMDMTMNTPDGTTRLDLFTMNRYMTTTKYKLCHFYCLPMSLAMYLANIYDPEQHRVAKKISLEVGQLFQLQNDFLDCFGNPKGTGKESSDIKEGKCTWLAVVALQKATPAQKKIMEEHYGKEAEEDVQMIKDLYLELGLPTTFATAEEELFLRVQTQIQQNYSGQSQEVFLNLLKQQYNFKHSRLGEIC